MSVVSGISKSINSAWKLPKESIYMHLDSEARLPEEVVNSLVAIEGPVDVYCWYEGSNGLPKSGARFMKESIIKPLFAGKQDAKLYLYSLEAWDFKKGRIRNNSSTTSLGEAINRLNKAALECIYSSSFFHYCAQVSKLSDLYRFIDEELPKKEWLIKLSEKQHNCGLTVSNLFQNQNSLFDCIKEMDANKAYSLMQYVEGYYLIRESIKRGLSTGQKKIEIAFILPNDEAKYYLDFPKDIEKMLRMEFGDSLADKIININFQFFQYGKSPQSRPYIERKSSKVKAEDISSYFDFLIHPPTLRKWPTPLSRDIIHKLNNGD